MGSRPGAVGLVLSPFYVLGSVQWAVAAPGDQLGGVCPAGAGGLMLGLETLLKQTHRDAVVPDHREWWDEKELQAEYLGQRSGHCPGR